jgi:hypothetical protein
MTPSLRRRLLFPILILVVAGGLHLFSQRGAEAKRAAMAGFASEVLRGGDARATDPLIVREIARRFASGTEFEVEIRDGDGGPVRDGAATHVAMVRIRGLAALGLRCRYDSDPSRWAIVGVFEPGS